MAKVKMVSREHTVLGACLLTFFLGVAADADPKSEMPTRIKRDGQGLNTKSSGYHNGVGSPSREASDEYYLLVPEEPKTDQERSRRKLEASQLPKILTVLKTGNFSKAEQLLTSLAQAMAIDSQSRYCYQRLAALCADRMDTEYWYRYDLKDIKRARDTRLSIAGALPEQGTVTVQSSQSVQSLRKEAWFLLQAGAKGK